MIQKENFKELLQHLKFIEENNIFIKFFRDVALTVDFSKEKIIYPEALKVNGDQVCNFSQNENFVVFECVHRLLEKGYKPEHLELEPKWKLGHGASGGRADILVRDREAKALLMIECKTSGAEFEKEKKKMQSHGGQLFSYLSQERSTEYLCLYASDLIEQNIQYNSLIVKIQDRKADEEAFKAGDDSIKLYRNANNNKELFAVWKETFNLYFHYNGIFEEDINAYSIELKPLKKKNLKPLKEAQSIFNIFMEILRHNNISDNANAFNRMLSLLLCKIVDEEKKDGDILDFQIKEGEDDAEKIQDRLQKLYAKGMKEHLDEDIVYYEDSVIDDIVKKYPRQTPMDKIKNIFKQIKYYTQNEFALKEVHNKELFEQNARVLNEVIRMLQNYRFFYTKKQQILGDFFELLLAHGVKQSEGQFFTPLPVVRFMVLSLGLDKMIAKKIKNKEKNFLPKILDYACGAGHFLTESIDELQNHIKNLDENEITDKDIKKSLKKYQNNTEWAKEYIFGIEKDYRLARTSQIACFLNGDGDANIIYGDGLVEHTRLNTRKNPFDVVIANPPYAIKSFKNYLQIKPDDYDIYECLTENSKEIETLFVERTAQVLKEKGKAAIILPSSILSNNSKPYQTAREILLENFEIKAVSEFGSGTFGATGTSTVILFLQKRSADFKKDRKYISKNLFNGVERKRKLEHIDSAMLLQKYIAHREIKQEDYQSLLKKEANEKIKQTDFWQEYQDWFDNLSEIKQLKTQTNFKNFTEQEQIKKLEQLFYQKILAKEQEKFYFFMLSFDNNHKSQKTILVKTGEKKTAKAFIGYEFSTRKGSEGIKIFRDIQGNPTTKLYDDNNHNNPEKASSYILKNFWNEEITEINKNIAEHVSITSLTSMLDFSLVEFSKAISLNSQNNIHIETNYELVKLGEVVETIESGNRPKGGVGNIASGVWSLGGEHINATNGMVDLDEPKYVSLDFYQNSPKGLLKENDILLCKDGALTGKIALLRKELNNQEAMVNEHVFILRTSPIEKQKYIFNFLFSKNGQTLLKQNITGSAQGGINMTNLKNIKIPLPPVEIQQKIVSECEAVDNEVEQSRQTITDTKQQIEEKVQSTINANHKTEGIDQLVSIVRGASPRPIQKYLTNVSTGINWIKIGDGKVEDKYITNSKEKITKEGAEKSRLINAGDLILSNSMSVGRPYISKISGCVHDGWLIFQDIDKKLNKDFLYLILSSKNIQNEFTNKAEGSVVENLNIDRVKSIKIPVPPLEIQKKLVAEVEELEETISKAQEILDNSATQKNTILKKHL